ncbi:MAG TPA: M13 family metallopeptidase [Longimicrobiales bacterium]|nr:M13 family metallopeptidase [Longimicrobiales bacterium]
MNRKPFLLLALLGIAAATPVSAQQKASGHALGIDVQHMDRSVRPQDDFFSFVSGNWVKNTEIPADQTMYGSFAILREETATKVRTLVQDAAARTNAPAGSVIQKVGAFYRAYMDSARVEALGLKPLQGELDRIAAIKTPADLAAAFANNTTIGVRNPFAAGVQQDPKNSDAYIIGIGQSGLGMPDRDYYLRNDEKFASVRKAYADYVTRVLELAKQQDAAGAAQRILALETRLAEKQWDRARNRDRNATYNKFSQAELVKLSKFDWTGFFSAAGVAHAGDVIVRQPDYLQALDVIMAETPVSTWKEYMTFALLNNFASELPSAFVNASFDFNGRVIAGAQEIRSRDKRATSAAEGAIGEAVGQLYVEKHFNPAAKARMDELVKNLLAAFKVGIDELEWMSPETKAQAQEKLAKFKVKIGYTEKWQDYSALDIRPDDVLGNAMRAARFRQQENVKRLGKPVERWRWGFLPQTVNASYSSSNNEITFPAGILQPPFFNVDADDAVNYGGIGAVIGHEISHGFDDQGRKSDGNGNLRDWWTPEDAKKFEERTTKLGAQYESYAPIEGMKINGKLTMGENIGDLSGVAVAYRAYRMSLQGKPAPVIDGFTGDQRFFMGWAQVWRIKARTEALRNQLLTDSHSPGRYRAFVPLTNFDPFYAAWDIKQGDQLYRAPEDRVKVW